MTDKEKAHEYAIGLNCEEMKMGELMALRQGGELGYLFGLTEGRKEKWHDLRKDPNDLPTTEDLHNFSKYVLCALKFNDFVFYQVMNIHYPSKTWIVVDSNKNYSDRNVIAWCELSKFKE